MSVQMKVGDFQLNTISGNLSVTGVGFQPKLILFYHTPDTVDIVNQTANWNLSYGITDGTTQGSSCIFAPNGNAGLEVSYQVQATTNCIVGSINTVAWRCTIVSMDGDGFTINQPAGGLPGVPVRVGYLAIGGTLTGYKAGFFQAAAATGAQSITGLGFQPTGLIVFGGSSSTVVANPTALVATHTSFSFGMSDGTSGRVAGYALRSGGVGTKVRGRTMRNDAIMAAPTPNATFPSTSLAYRSSLTSFDVGGFTINNVQSGGNRYFFYLAFAGSATKVGNFSSPNLAGAFSVGGLTFDPASVITASTYQSAYNIIEGQGQSAGARGALLSTGMATDATQQMTIGATAADFVSTSIEGHHSESTKTMRRFAHNPFTTLEMDFAHVGMASGQINFTCTTPSATISQINYMAIEGAMFTPPPSDPTGGSGDPDSPDSIFLLKYMGL